MAIFAACLLRLVPVMRTAASPEMAIRSSGDCSLMFLAATLAITPLRRLLGVPNIIQLRRMLGLFAFFYACIHLLEFRLHHVIEASPRLNLRLAVVALIPMVPLAATSTSGWIQRLDGRGWRMLHTLVYPGALLDAAPSHLIARNRLGPVLCAGLVALVLIFRIGLTFVRGQRVRHFL